MALFSFDKVKILLQTIKGETRNKGKDKITNKRKTRAQGECLSRYTQKPERKGQ